MKIKTYTAYEISLGLIPDPVNGQKIKPDDKFLRISEITDFVKFLEKEIGKKKK